MLRASYVTLRIQRQYANSVDPDEAAHYELPHLDLRCLQMQIFSILSF